MSSAPKFHIFKETSKGKVGCKEWTVTPPLGCNVDPEQKDLWYGRVFFCALRYLNLQNTDKTSVTLPWMERETNSSQFPPDRIVKWLLFADKNLQRIRASTGYCQFYCQGKPICLWRFSAFLSFFILYLHVGRDIGGGEAGSHPVDFTLPAEHHQ